MKLTRVEIDNFRSIKEQIIYFTDNCRILIGINEAGKTNVLKALSLLSTEYTPTIDDLRQVLPQETAYSESKISFIFSLDTDNIKYIYEKSKAKLLSSNPEQPIVHSKSEQHSFRELCKIQNSGVYIVNILNRKKTSTYFTVSKQYSIVKGWATVKKECPDDFQIQTRNGEIFVAKNYKFIYTPDFILQNPAYFEKCDIEDVNYIIGLEIIELINNNLPEVIYWEYDESNLLPARINFNLFMDDPSICLPLKQMFHLAKIKDITQTMSMAKERSYGIKNLLNKVAVETTHHFKKVWKEYKGVSFSLSVNGEFIEASIKEKNDYEPNQRSDGFKRFISFLLLVSSRVKMKNLHNALLIVDEPDIGLHPSGIRYLRDELLKISKDNYVVYTSHSIFMVDANKIGRHYIVKKANEITQLEDVNESNLIDEEIIYNAMGFSVFDHLNKLNLLFEGWKDKKLFKTVLANIPDRYDSIKKKFSKVGICHLYGVKSVKCVSPVFEISNRKIIILSDNDEIAIEQKKLHEKENGYGIWKTFSDISPQFKQITVEDFLDSAYILIHLKKIIESLSINDQFDINEINNKMNKLHIIKNWLSARGLKGEELKGTLSLLKDNLFENITINSIDVSYFEYLSETAKLID